MMDKLERNHTGEAEQLEKWPIPAGVARCLETLRQAAEANDTARVEALLAEAVPTYHKEEPQKA